MCKIKVNYIYLTPNQKKFIKKDISPENCEQRKYRFFFLKKAKPAFINLQKSETVFQNLILIGFMIIYGNKRTLIIIIGSNQSKTIQELKQQLRLQLLPSLFNTGTLIFVNFISPLFTWLLSILSNIGSRVFIHLLFLSL